MPYRRVLSTLGCAEMGLPESMALAGRHGLDGVELRAAAGTLDLPLYLGKTYGTPAALERQLPEAGARIPILDTSLSLGANTPADRAALLEFVPWAEGLGVPWLRVFDGDCAAGRPGENQARETIQWWRELRHQQGWTVDCVVETHDSLLDANLIMHFVAGSPGTKILWDTHHTWKRRGEDPLATWRAIRPHVVHLHVKDSVSRPNADFPFTYVPPGQGEFPMAPLVGALREEFTGVVCLEWERLWHPDLAPLDTALAAAAAARWW
ncbi:MAG TPA: sugar phosphate isomerase/epimerase [Candidatus Didemnitutus sp.]|jgi:sugar phosphate isomerase/epimerase